MRDAEPVFSVTELNQYVNLLLGQDGFLSELTVRGEISGFKRHISGHLYFTLKDENSSVRAVMFKFSAMRLNFFPKDGMSVEIKGHAGLYDKDGSFQIYADSMSALGSGDLLRRFLEYKAALEKKGWFDASIKKTLPFLPSAVGVVTSSSGAAIEDIRKVITRRFPAMPVILYPAQVQGDDAAGSIAAAIIKADAEKRVDVLIVGRGGGSLEDLWAFNEPAVADAVHACELPVISAVGHEIDFSICDFVADVRAATPSAAAEIAVPEREVLQDSLNVLKMRLLSSLSRGHTEKRAALALLSRSPCLKNPQILTEKIRLRLDNAYEQFAHANDRAVSVLRTKLALYEKTIACYSPELLLKRGFLLASDKNGRPIYSASFLAAGDSFFLKFHDGTVHAVVTKVDIKTEDDV